MTTVKQVKKRVLASIVKTLKVTKDWQAIGRDNYRTGLPVKLEDFTITFKLPNFNFGITGFNDGEVEAEIRVRKILREKRKK